MIAWRLVAGTTVELGRGGGGETERERETQIDRDRDRQRQTEADRHRETDIDIHTICAQCAGLELRTKIKGQHINPLSLLGVRHVSTPTPLFLSTLILS